VIFGIRTLSLTGLLDIMPPAFNDRICSKTLPSYEALCVVGQPLPQLIHLTFGLVLASMMYLFGRRFANARVGLVSAVIVYTLPVITVNSLLRRGYSDYSVVPLFRLFRLFRQAPGVKELGPLRLPCGAWTRAIVLVQDNQTMKPSEGSKPIFIIGCPRSGTSILAWSLAQHPHLWTSSESDFVYDMFGEGRLRESFQKSYERSDKPWLAENQVSYVEFAAYMGLGIDLLFRSRAGNKRWIDSTPTYTKMADDLALLFPGARFLHIIRDARAVVSSMIHSGFDEPFTTNFKAACQTWVHYVRLGIAFQRAHTDRAMETRLEWLVEDSALQFNRILEFLGAERCGASAEFFRTNRINSSYGNLTPDDMRLPKPETGLPQAPWRRWSNGMRRQFIRIAGPTMSALGYSVEFD